MLIGNKCDLDRREAPGGGDRSAVSSVLVLEKRCKLVGLEHFLFVHLLGMIIPIEIILFGGVETTNQ